MIDFTYRSIPDYTMAALQRYIRDRVPTGGFLEAVLSNDLREACARADENNERVLPELVAYLYNEAPRNCWGSRELYKAWLAQEKSA
jgi:hypothetical protein